MLFRIIFLLVSVNYCCANVAKRQSKIVRPCRLDDYACIGSNIAANSRCSPRGWGAIPSAYELYNVRFETPYFNASYIDRKIIVRNHDKCYVSEFFFNTETDRAVLAVDCPSLGFQCDRTVIQHYTLLEDSIFSYKINATYPLVRFTTNLPHADKLDLCSAFTFADVTALPIFHVDPDDQKTEQFLTQELSELFIYERETFLYRAELLMKPFIQAYISDCGC